MKGEITRRSILAALAAGATTLCTPARVRSQGASTLRIAVVLTDAAAEPYYAKETGFFARNGIDASIQAIRESGTAPALAPNDFDIGYGVVDTVALAHLKGVPLAFIAAAAEYDATINAQVAAIVVPLTSTVHNAKDLNGKIIAVTNLRSLSENGPRAWIDQNGGDSSTVKFVEIPFPAMPAALAAGRIDAANVAEPFLSVAKQNGRVLVYGFDGIGPRFLIAGWVATPQFINANRNLVRRFVSAIHQTGAWANANRSQSAVLLTKFASIDPAVIPQLTRAHYAEELTAASLQPLIDVAARYDGFTPFPAAELISTL